MVSTTAEMSLAMVFCARQLLYVGSANRYITNLSFRVIGRAVIMTAIVSDGQPPNDVVVVTLRLPLRDSDLLRVVLYLLCCFTFTLSLYRHRKTVYQTQAIEE